MNAPPAYAGALTSEVDGVNVELTSSPSRPVYRGRLLFTMEGRWELTLGVAREGKRFEPPLTERVGR